MDKLTQRRFVRRVQIHSTLAAWVQDRSLGEIIGEVKRGRNQSAFRLRLDKSGRTISFTVTTATQTNTTSSKSDICEFL